jgi:hypothetical protein
MCQQKAPLKTYGKKLKNNKGNIHRSWTTYEATDLCLKGLLGTTFGPFGEAWIKFKVLVQSRIMPV